MKRAALTFVVLVALGLCAFYQDHLVLQIQNAGSAIATWADWGVLNFNSGCTTSVSGATVNVSCSGSTFLNVLDYRADPSGVTANFDTVVLPAAVAACQAASVTAGCTIFIPQGRFKMSSAGYVLSAPSITLRGVGRGSVITQAAPGNGSTIYMLQLTGTNQRVSELTFSGQSTQATDNTTYQYCIEVNGANSAMIDTNIFTGLNAGVNGCNVNIFDEAGSTQTQMLYNNEPYPPIGNIGSKGYGLLESGTDFQYIGNTDYWSSVMGRHHVYISQSAASSAQHGIIAHNMFFGGTNAVIECNAFDTSGDLPVFGNMIEDNLIDQPSMIYASADVGAIDLNANCRRNQFKNNRIIQPGGAFAGSLTANGTTTVTYATGGTPFSSTWTGSMAIDGGSYTISSCAASGLTCTMGSTVAAGTHGWNYSQNVLTGTLTGNGTTTVTWATGGSGFGQSWNGQTLNVNGTNYTISSCAAGGATCVLTGFSSSGSFPWTFTSLAGAGISITGDSATSETGSPWSITGTCTRINNLDTVISTNFATNAPLVGQTVTISGTTGGAGSPPTCNGSGFIVQSATTNAITFQQYGTNTVTNSGVGTVTYVPARADDNTFENTDIESPMASGIVCAACFREVIHGGKIFDPGAGGTYAHAIWLAALNGGQVGASFNRVEDVSVNGPNYMDYSLVIDAGSVTTANGNYVNGNYFPSGGTGAILDNSGSPVLTQYGSNFVNNNTPLGALNGAITTNQFLIGFTAPTISSGFGSTPSIASSNGTATFTINVGSGGTASSGVIGLPTSANGWKVQCDDLTTQSTSVFLTKQIASGATTATITNYNTAGAATAWAANDILSCMALAR